ncbi:uncharacterized protein [Pleurodeles waltl]|uniref:uncharacterized protein isoform X2 n=1 Tax=Pleurodeles waltl TaxID=8319 RepID=UPI0037097927
MSAESLPNCRRINTRSASRHVAETPPAMDSDSSYSVSSPSSPSDSSSSISPTKKESNKPDVLSQKGNGSGDGSCPVPNGKPATENGSSAGQNGKSDVNNVETARKNDKSAAQGNDTTVQDGGSSLKDKESATKDGRSVTPASHENESVTQDNGSAAQDKKNPKQDQSATQSSRLAVQLVLSKPLPSVSPATSQGQDSSSFCGGPYRRRKANFSNEETETLVKNVVKHFSALYGVEAWRTESTRRNQRRSQLWNQIQRHVNDLGYTPRSIDDLKHKWRDIRLDVKRKVTTKRSSSSIFNTRLTPMEKLVASTIGQSHLDGENDGIYHEPVAPKPEPSKEIAVMTPAILTTTSQTPAILTTATHLTFIAVPGATVTKERAVDVSKQEVIDQKPTPATLTAVEADTGPSPSVGAHDGDSGRCDSHGSMVSSPAGSVGQVTTQVTTQRDWGNEGSSDKLISTIGSDQIEAFKFKMEEEDEEELPVKGGRQEMDIGSLPSEPMPPAWQDSQEEWEQQSGSPQRSDNAREDSLHSSASQEGTRTPATELPTREGCSCLLEDRRTMWRTNMQRLLELEEQWDQLYHQELAMWEEERLQQREQRVQDRLLQQQLLGVLTDIRDELKQIREQRAASQENHVADSPSQGGDLNQACSVEASSPESVPAAQTNGDSVPCSPKSTVPRGRTASTSSASWSPKSGTSRRRPVSTATAAWSLKSFTPRSSGRPRGRPRKYPIEEYDGGGHS